MRGWLSGRILRDGACERWEKRLGLMDFVDAHGAEAA